MLDLSRHARHLHTPELMQLLQSRFPALRLVGASFDDSAFAGSTTRVVDAERDFVVHEVSIPMRLHATLRMTDVEGLWREVHEVVRGYQWMVDAWEGRRPVVWS